MSEGMIRTTSSPHKLDAMAALLLPVMSVLHQPHKIQLSGQAVPISFMECSLDSSCSQGANGWKNST